MGQGERRTENIVNVVFKDDFDHYLSGVVHIPNFPLCPFLCGFLCSFVLKLIFLAVEGSIAVQRLSACIASLVHHYGILDTWR